ncbi:isoprenoid synthase domain-containing protein, partial [Pavlovales sp. CCMP2436]
MVRNFDHERYLCNLFLPPPARPTMFAVHAFNLELARVREVVSEPTIRRMRFQWWRDTLESSSRGRPSANPVAEGLANVLAARPLMRPWLDRLIVMREVDLDIVQQPETMSWVDDYAAGTAGSLVHCAVEAVDAGSLDAAHEAARHIGRAHGLVTALRGTPFHLAQGYTYLPRALTAAHGVLPRDLFNGRRVPALDAAVGELAESARQSLREGDAIASKLPAHARAAVVPAAVCGTYLAALASVGNNLFDPRL